MPAQLKSIERVRGISAEDLFSDFVCPQRPVILSDLYTDGMDTVRDPTRFEQRLGHVAVGLQREYAHASVPRYRDNVLHFPYVVRDDHQSVAATTISTYLALPLDHPDRELSVIEAQTPSDVRALFPLPSCANHRSPDDIVSLIFVAHAGHFAHLHYDGDGRDTLLTQVLGRKRVAIAPPACFELAEPFTSDSSCNFSTHYLEHLEPEERQELLFGLGAWEAVVEPGETLYIPMFHWHWVEYVDACVSFSVRLGRSPIVRKLVELSHSLWPEQRGAIQSIAGAFGDESRATQAYGDDVNTLVQLLAAARAGGAGEAIAFHRAVMDLHAKVLSRPYGRRATFADLVRRTVRDEVYLPVREVAARAWTEEDVPARRRGYTVHETVTSEGRAEFLVVALNVVVSEIELADDYQSGLTKQLLRYLAEPQQTLCVGALASRLACESAHLIELLVELASSGVIVPAPSPQRKA
jgi:hypothetical protein